MSILAEKLRRVRRQLSAALLPQDCLLCAAPAGNDMLCADCRSELPVLPAARCPRCAQPTAGGDVCGRCQRHPPHFDRIVAAFPYAFPIDRMLQQLKYAHRLALAGWLGEHLPALVRDLGADLIVPMPLHATRMSERGFNQAIEIARPLARERGLALAAAVCSRQRATAPQEGLKLLERRRNLKNAFACSEDFGGRHVLLVDDVVTTGASVDECARTLKLHGAGEVSVVAVARTLRD